MGRNAKPPRAEVPPAGAEKALEVYLHEHIPLSEAAGVRVEEHTEGRVVLSAPIEPNLNHRGTAFGGSVATLAILAGWAHVHFRAAREGKGSEIHTVIQRSSVEYVAPAESELRATCLRVSDEAWDRFLRVLKRAGRGRVHAEAVVEAGGRTIATFEGSYVVLRR